MGGFFFFDLVKYDSTCEISAEKNFVFCIARKIAVLFDAKHSTKTQQKDPLKRSFLSLKRAEFLPASAQAPLNGLPGHMCPSLLAGGELLAHVSGLPVQEVPLALEAPGHGGRKEEDCGLLTW